MSDGLWTALALLLVLEGVLPFVAPATWRRIFSQMLQMQDGQIRFCGLVCLMVGGVLLWWLG
ncbi:MAG: DUF2065 domain-containing protein [Comamonadaceae bacterium]|nr:DUF2065 domain-containing protein [Burkholderiales bacterium]MEB2349546.1 DUF2065 domain-containing protein [Comamonadaceae bacterium]